MVGGDTFQHSDALEPKYKRLFLAAGGEVLGACSRVHEEAETRTCVVFCGQAGEKASKLNLAWPMHPALV